MYLENYREQNSTLSDTDGRFLLSGVPAGNHYLVAMKMMATYTVKVRSSGPGKRIRQSTAVQAGTLTLQSATASASGRLVDASGNPVRNGRMTLWGEAFYTDSNGYYTTPAMPENVTAPVIVAVPGYQPTEIEVKFTDNPPFIEQTIVNTSSTNRPPTCSLTASKYEVSPGTPVALAATASDPDQQLDEDNYGWAITGGIGTFSGSISGLKVTWAAPNESAVATITFTVTDNEGVKSQSSVQIVVGTGIYQPNIAPTLSAISSDLSMPIYTGSTGLLSVVATDSNGDMLYYKWSADGSFSTTSASSTYWTTPTIDATQTVTVTVSVDDRKGGQATATRDFVISYIENDAPFTPQIIAPLAGQLFLPGQTVNFIGSATDPQDGVLTGAGMSWFLNGGLFRQGSADFDYSLPTTPATYVVKLQVVDKYNVSADTFDQYQSEFCSGRFNYDTNGWSYSANWSSHYLYRCRQRYRRNYSQRVIHLDFPGLSRKDRQSLRPAWWLLAEGSNQIQVCAIDSIGVGATATINITIENAGPTIQIDSPTVDAVALGEDVTITGSGIDNITKLALPAASMTWKLYDGAVATYTLKEGSASFVASFTKTGTHVLTLVGSDQAGKTTSTSHRFSVNTNPTVAITLPASGTRYDLGAPITFNADVTDSPGEEDYLNASWSSSINGHIGVASDGDDLFYSNLSSGSHVITCQGINARSGLASSTSRMILVNTLPVGTLTLDLSISMQQLRIMCRSSCQMILP